MRYFLDTEFLETGQTIELISIAIVSDEGDSYYAVVSDADWQRILQDGWVKQHVVPQLPKMGTAEWKPRAQIAQEIVEFVGP